MLLLILDVFGLALWPTFSFSQHFSFWQFARATGRSTVLIAGDAVFNRRRRSRQECESQDRTRNLTKTVCIQRNFSKFRRVSVPLPSTHALSVSGRRSLACVGSGSHAHRLMFCALCVVVKTCHTMTQFVRSPIVTKAHNCSRVPIKMTTHDIPAGVITVRSVAIADPRHTEK